MTKHRVRELRRYDLTGHQAAVLIAIRSIGDHVTSAEISRWLLREPNTVSEILTRMEKKDLVVRVRDLPRKDMVQIVLTKRGIEAYNNAVKQDSIYKTMSVLSEEECQQLWSLLNKLLEQSLKQLGGVREKHHEDLQ